MKVITLRQVGAFFLVLLVLGVLALRCSDATNKSKQKEHVASLEQELPHEQIKRVGEMCHLEKLSSKDIDIIASPKWPQPLRGGAIRNGVYDTESYEVHANQVPNGLPQSFRQTIVIEQNGALAKNVRRGVHGELETSTWAAQTHGNRLKLAGLCPSVIAGAEEEIEYEALGEQLITRFVQQGQAVTVRYRRHPGGN